MKFQFGFGVHVREPLPSLHFHPSWQPLHSASIGTYVRSAIRKADSPYYVAAMNAYTPANDAVRCGMPAISQDRTTRRH